MLIRSSWLTVFKIFYSLTYFCILILSVLLLTFFFGVFCCRASDVKNHSYDDRFGGFLLLILSLNLFFFFSFKSLLENKDGRGEGVTKLLIKEARKAE